MASEASNEVFRRAAEQSKNIVAMSGLRRALFLLSDENVLKDPETGEVIRAKTQLERLQDAEYELTLTHRKIQTIGPKENDE